VLFHLQLTKRKKQINHQMLVGENTNKGDNFYKKSPLLFGEGLLCVRLL